MAERTSNMDIIHDFLVGKGLSDEATAGIMGNIQQESNYSPTATNESSGAYGIFQWLGNRKTSLENYAKILGKSASDLNIQLDFFWDEMQTTEINTYEALTTGENKTASEYAEIFEQLFERSGGSGMTNRKEYAEEVYNLYGTTATSKYNMGLKWWGDVVRVVAVLVTICAGVGLMILAVGGVGDSVKKQAVKKVVDEVKGSEE